MQHIKVNYRSEIRRFPLTKQLQSYNVLMNYLQHLYNISVGSRVLLQAMDMKGNASVVRSPADWLQVIKHNNPVRLVLVDVSHKPRTQSSITVTVKTLKQNAPPNQQIQNQQRGQKTNNAPHANPSHVRSPLHRPARSHTVDVSAPDRMWRPQALQQMTEEDLQYLDAADFLKLFPEIKDDVVRRGIMYNGMSARGLLYQLPELEKQVLKEKKDSPLPPRAVNPRKMLSQAQFVGSLDEASLSHMSAHELLEGYPDVHQRLIQRGVHITSEMSALGLMKDYDIVLEAVEKDRQKYQTILANK